MNKVGVVIVIIICTGCFIGGIATERCTSVPKEIIRIVGIEKPVIKYIKVPTTCKEFQNCYKQPIQIDGKIVDAVWFLATATDSCKTSSRRFKLEAKRIMDNPNIIQLQYIHFFNFRETLSMDMGANVSYYRKLISIGKCQFGIGGGVSVTNNSAGLNVGTMFQF
jgi:hypothetical protein